MSIPGLGESPYSWDNIAVSATKNAERALSEVRKFRNDLAVTDPKAWNQSLWNLYGAQSVSGENVNEYTALNYSAVWNAVTLYAGTISTLPLHLLRKDGKKKVFASEKSLFRIMYAQANKFMSATSLRSAMVAHILTWGNAYAEIVRDGYGFVRELWPITPNRVKPKWSDGGIVYDVEVGGQTIPLSSEKVLHLHGLGFDGLVGYSIIAMARKSIGLGMAMETFGAAYFGSGTHPGMIVEHPGKLTETGSANLKESLHATYSGLGQAHRIMLLEEGMKANPITIQPEDAQFLECVTPETFLSMADGTRKQAQDIETGDYVIGWKDNIPIIATVKAVGFPKKKNLIRIKTARGRELTASEDHPCLTIQKLRTAGGRVPKTDPAEWMSLKDIKTGNYVRVALDMPSTEGNMPFEVGYFLGAMAGDGYIRKASCSFSSADDGVTQYLCGVVNRLGGELKRRGGTYNFDIITNGKNGCKSSQIRRLFNDSGLVGQHSHTKRVPITVLKGGAEAWMGFLSGYFDTDGSIRDIDGNQTLAAYWSSVSRPLLDECQHMLAMLGIQSSIYRMYDGGNKNIIGQQCETLPSWGLYVMGNSPLSRLAVLLSLAHEEKSRRLSAYKELPKSKYREENFQYDRIISVEELGEGATIGIEIEGCHTHVTAGIVTHNSRQFQVPEIARWFNLPPHKLKDLTRSSFNNIESEQISFVVDSVLPWLIALEQQYDMQLLTLPEQTRENLFHKHNVEGLLRGDAASRAALYRAMFNVGALSPNDIRDKEDLDPIDEEFADDYFVPLNMVPLSMVRETLTKKQGAPAPADGQNDGQSGGPTP